LPKRCAVLTSSFPIFSYNLIISRATSLDIVSTTALIIPTLRPTDLEFYIVNPCIKSTIFFAPSAFISVILLIAFRKLSIFVNVLSSTLRLDKTVFTFPIDVATLFKTSLSIYSMDTSPFDNFSNYSPTVAADSSLAVSTIPYNKLIIVESAFCSIVSFFFSYC